MRKTAGIIATAFVVGAKTAGVVARGFVKEAAIDIEALALQLGYAPEDLQDVTKLQEIYALARKSPALQQHLPALGELIQAKFTPEQRAGLDSRNATIQQNVSKALTMSPGSPERRQVMDQTLNAPVPAGTTRSISAAGTATLAPSQPAKPQEAVAPVAPAPATSAAPAAAKPAAPGVTNSLLADESALWAGRPTPRGRSGEWQPQQKSWGSEFERMRQVHENLDVGGGFRADGRPVDRTGGRPWTKQEYDTRMQRLADAAAGNMASGGAPADVMSKYQNDLAGYIANTTGQRIDAKAMSPELVKQHAPGFWRQQLADPKSSWTNSMVTSGAGMTPAPIKYELPAFNTSGAKNTLRAPTTGGIQANPGDKVFTDSSGRAMAKVHSNQIPSTIAKPVQNAAAPTPNAAAPKPSGPTPQIGKGLPS